MFHNYPYSDFHELNLSWLLKEFSALKSSVEKWMLLNKITFADPIEWDPANYYLKYTIVIDPVTLNTYIAIQDVPRGIALNNSDYWALIGNYNAQLKYMTDQRYFNSLDDGSDLIFYVSANGDDTATGSRSNPFQTVKKAAQAASERFDDIRINIITSGEYEVDMLTYSANALHITAEAPDVTLNFRNASFYDAHLNLHGYSDSEPMIINSSRADELFYLDGGQLTAHYIDFNCYLRLNGARGMVEGCILHNLYLYGANFIFDGQANVFSDPVRVDVPAIRSYNSDLFANSVINFELTQNNVADFMYLNGGNFIIGNGCTNVTGFVYNGNIDCNRTGLYANATDLDAFEAMAAGAKTYGALVNEVTPKEYSITQHTTAVATNAYTSIHEMTLDPGNWIIGMTLVVNGGADFYGNIRVTLDDGKVIYDSFQGVAGKNNFKNLSFYAASGTAQTVKVEVQYFSGISVQVSGRYKRL